MVFHSIPYRLVDSENSIVESLNYECKKCHGRTFALYNINYLPYIFLKNLIFEMELFVGFRLRPKKM